MSTLAWEVAEGAAAASVGLGPWFCCARRPATGATPEQLADADVEWLPAAVPGTVAAALQAAGLWSFDQPRDLDVDDWWFRTTFAAPETTAAGLSYLCFDGLATHAEVFLNGRRLLATDNMFRAYRIDVSSLLQSTNELVIVFRSLSEELKRKCPRPRWKTNLVQQQQLRRHRTSLLGRIPGWAPCAPTIGPWRDVRLESSPFLLDDVHLTTRCEESTGVVTICARVFSATMPERAVLRVGDIEASLKVRPDAEGEGRLLAGEVRVPDAPRWWPHTHGEPSLLSCDLTLTAAGIRHAFSCGNVGFRELEMQADSGFAVRVNGEPIYCRGACWTVGDLLSPACTEAVLRHDLSLARDAGVNMLRVGGTMTYESDLFYRLCDELGILVWQDFMFANMDYPVDEPAFRENIAVEAVEQLQRLAKHPCVAVYCGNSEIEQQAAMLGLPREAWSNSWFARRLPELCTANHPGTGYVPSTPTGGALPFHTDTGITHYYGIGAYLRSPSELRQADVKFTPECLGFANVPEPQTVFTVTGGSHAVTHDPRWKRRVPRDNGAGWDFEDVRDHYLRELYGVDPVQLRSWDTPRYWQLSRAVSGEMMAQTFSEWRSTHGRNRGGLVWFYKDLWPGAGWGIVDSTGIPKAAYYFLKRTWRSRQLTLTSEGLNGLHLHLTNETSEPCSGTLEIALLKEPHVVVARQETAVRLEPRSQQRFCADAVLGRFYDVAYAYRFGPPPHDVVAATWYDESRQIVGEAFHFIRRRIAPAPAAGSIDATAEKLSDELYRVTVQADRFLHTVRLHAEGFLPDDNYFHLAPQRSKAVLFRPLAGGRPRFQAALEALNLDTEVPISLIAANS